MYVMCCRVPQIPYWKYPDMCARSEVITQKFFELQQLKKNSA